MNAEPSTWLVIFIKCLLKNRAGLFKTRFRDTLGQLLNIEERWLRKAKSSPVGPSSYTNTSKLSLTQTGAIPEHQPGEITVDFL